VTDLINSGTSVEFRLDYFVSLEETLEFSRELVVLVRDQVHVLSQGIDLTLFDV